MGLHLFHHKKSMKTQLNYCQSNNSTFVACFKLHYLLPKRILQYTCKGSMRKPPDSSDAVNWGNSYCNLRINVYLYYLSSGLDAIFLQLWCKHVLGKYEKHHRFLDNVCIHIRNKLCSISDSDFVVNMHACSNYIYLIKYIPCFRNSILYVLSEEQKYNVFNSITQLTILFW